MAATLDILTDAEIMRQIRRSEAYFAAGHQGLSLEEAFGAPRVRNKRKRRR